MLLALLISACTGEEPAPGEPCEAGGDATLTIGTGELAFAELDPSDPVLELVHGPQGGYHVLIGLEATFLDASDYWEGQFRGYIGEVELATSFPILDMRCNGGEVLQSWGTFLIYEAEPEDLDGQLTRVEVDIVDASGQVVSAVTEARIEDPWLER